MRYVQSWKCSYSILTLENNLNLFVLSAFLVGTLQIIYLFEIKNALKNITIALQNS